MKSSRFLHTSIFRLTALYAGIAAICFVMLYLITFATLTSALRGEIRARITEDLDALAEETVSDGYSAAVSDIYERIRGSQDKGAFFYLADRNGKRVAGNLDKMSLREGWIEQPLDDKYVPDIARIADEDHQIWGEGRVLKDGSFLFAGVDAHQVLSAQESFIDTFLWLAGVALSIDALMGVIINLRFLRRIDAINRASAANMEGPIKARIPVRNSLDEIDKLSFNLNKLFESNQRLVDSQRLVAVSIAHDLRTPLGRLRIGLEKALERSHDVEALREATEAALVNTNEILAMFSALLRIAEVESGARQAAFRMVNLSSLLHRLCAAYAPVAEDEGKQLMCKIEKGQIITGDEDLLLQALANLVENAIKHTPTGTAITVELKQVDGRLEIAVADTGNGIPTEMRTQVFERFFRLDQSRSTAGSGLGLTLVAAVAELHKLEVYLEDNAPGLRITLKSGRRTNLSYT